MSIDDLVKGVKSKVRGVHDYLSVPKNGRKTAEYAVRNYLDDDLKAKLFENKSEEEIDKLYFTLEDNIHKSMQFHKKNLNSFSRWLAMGSGVANLLNDIYNSITLVPPSLYTNVIQAGVYAKAIMEIPTMYHHVKDTHDMYGLMEWLTAKPIALLIPWLGTAYDIDVTGRIIRKQAIKEGLNNFLKEKGLIKEKKSLIQSINDRVKEVTGYTPKPIIAVA